MLSMCVMDIMNVLRTGMNMFISRIHVWLCYSNNQQEKENLPNCGLCCLSWPQRKKSKTTKRKISIWILPGSWKIKEHESGSYTNCNWCSWYSHQRIDKRIGGLGNERTSRDHPNYSIIKISLNAEKSPGDWRRLDVTQILVRNNQLTLVWKTLKGIK